MWSHWSGKEKGKRAPIPRFFSSYYIGRLGGFIHTSTEKKYHFWLVKVLDSNLNRLIQSCVINLSVYEVLSRISLLCRAIAASDTRSGIARLF